MTSGRRMTHARRLEVATHRSGMPVSHPEIRPELAINPAWVRGRWRPTAFAFTSWLASP